MARIMKKHNVRKNEIMQTARMLFYQKGYVQTTVNLIISTLGISKGAFYHYFKSKEDLLDQIIADFSRDIMKKLQPIIDDPSLNALEKFNQFYQQGGIYKMDRIELIRIMVEILDNEQNLLLKHKLRQRTLMIMLPVLVKIIEEGNKTGYFDVPFPDEAAKFIIASGHSLSDFTGRLLLSLKENPENLDELKNLFLVYERSVQGVLRTSGKQISLFDKKLLDNLKDF
jgi:AcrR family transcriptional regulator